MLRKHRNSLSIGTKTLISHLTLCVIVISLASVLSYALSSQYMRETRMEELLKKADYIAEITQSSQDGELTPRRRTVRMYENLTDCKVFFLNKDGETIRMTSNPDIAEADDPESALQWFDLLDAIDREFASRVLSGESVTAMQRFEFAQDEIIFAGVPILGHGGDVRGGVIIAQPVAQLRRLSRLIRFMLLIVMSVSLLLAVLLAMELTHMLVRPIKRITRAASRMEDGVYAERITQLPGDEIGELGHALNSMSGRLIDVIRNLRKERDKLELIISDLRQRLLPVL